MTREKIVMWKDPERDEDKEDKAAGLLKHLKQYEVQFVNAFEFTAMVVVKVSDEQAKKMAKDEEIVIEDNGMVYAMNETTASNTKPN